MTAEHPGLRRSGVVLFVTMVLLVVLATLAYTVTSRVAAYRHRARYLIDYTQARYARDSALRFSLTAVEGLDLTLISRPNEPDFSDLFRMSDEQIDELLGKQKTAEEPVASTDKADANRAGAREANAIGLDANTLDPWASLIQEEEKVVQGPYGPPWPLVAEPVEIEISSVQVRIEIEDENAKYPLAWMLLQDAALQRPANAGFETFCEWMGWTASEIDTVKEQLAQVAEIKGVSLQADRPGTGAAATTGPRTQATSAAARQAAAAVPRRTDVRTVTPAERQRSDLGRLVHSSLLDHDFLSRRTIVSDKRQESLSRYLGLWGTAQVNVNTAPRHVLEAAFAFVGDAGPMADALIRERQIQPFKDLSDFRKRVTRYADSLEKCSQYITFASTTFAIRITAIRGAARARAVAGVTKEGKTVKTIGVLSD